MQSNNWIYISDREDGSVGQTKSRQHTYCDVRIIFGVTGDKISTKG